MSKVSHNYYLEGRLKSNKYGTIMTHTRPAPWLRKKGAGPEVTCDTPTFAGIM